MQVPDSSSLITSARRDGVAQIVAVRGEIDLHNSPELRKHVLNLIAQPGVLKLILNLAEVPYMDSSAIAVLVESLQKMRKVGGKVFLTNLQPRVKGLLEIARLDAHLRHGQRRSRGDGAIAAIRMNFLYRPISLLGASAIGSFRIPRRARLPAPRHHRRGRQRSITGRAWRFAWKNLWAQMVRVGVQSIPIVSLVVFCIGAILALQMAPILSDYGAGVDGRRHHSHRDVPRAGAAGQRDRADGFRRRVASPPRWARWSSRKRSKRSKRRRSTRSGFWSCRAVLATTVMMVCVAVVGDLHGVLGGMLTSATGSSASD